LLSKSQIINELASDGVGGKQQIKNVLEALADLAESEISKGEDFVVPGIARVWHRYTKPRKKGEKYVGFGGVEAKAEKARAAKLTLKASVAGKLKKSAPSLRSKGGKAVAARKG
jgi:hypothetical protein